MATPEAPPRSGFAGLPVLFLESRRASEMADLIRRQGGEPLAAPALREAPLEENAEAFRFYEHLRRGSFDLVVLLTGVGTSLLFQLLCTRHPQKEVREAFRRAKLLVRGPKPAKALADFGLKADFQVPEPNTWREILAELDRDFPPEGRRVAVQEYGVPNAELLKGLLDRGALAVHRLPVYRWTMPEDPGPLRAAVERLCGKERGAILFTSAQQVRHLFRAAREAGREEDLRRGLPRWAVASIGPVASETLREFGVEPDLEPSHPKMGFLVKETARQAAAILQRKSAGGVRAGGPREIASPKAPLLLRALAGAPVPRPPVWVLRQAGRYLPEYRKIREKMSFLELCRNPDLCAEAAVTAQGALGADAAILFSDLLLVAEPLGLGLRYAEPGGPVIERPVRSTTDVARLEPSRVREGLSFAAEAVRRTKSALPPDVPLIGFAGAPFTLAAYLVEGTSSRTFERTRAFRVAEEGVFRRLLETLAEVSALSLEAQAEAGADVLMLFDTWVGLLPRSDFETLALPSLRDLVARLRRLAPVVYFGTDMAHLLPALPSVEADGFGIDWRLNLAEAARILEGFAVQGNLDPAVLLTNPGTVRAATGAMLESVRGRAGYVANLGHGILPETPVECARAFIETVKAFSWAPAP